MIPSSTILNGSREDISLPLNVIFPVLGCKKPEILSSSVDLPAVLAPIRVTISLGHMAKETSHSAWKLPWETSILFTSRSGSFKFSICSF